MNQFANSFVGEYLKIHINTGIFRACDAHEWLHNISDDITGNELLQGIITNGIRADYISNIDPHDLVGKQEYCHFTSPIRRLSDCVCHYLLKYIFNIHKSTNITNTLMPFTETELNYISSRCTIVNRTDKKHQYLDNKFRLLQIMHAMISKNGSVDIEYYITDYNGLFLNIIIYKIDDFSVYLSYTLRICNYISRIQSNNNLRMKITYINCLTKYDENTIPELDKKYINNEII
jgi:hypothetical protein